MSLTRRQTILAIGTAFGAVPVTGCLGSDLPLFEVDLYNDVDRPVTASASVRDVSRGETVVSASYTLPPVDATDNRVTVTDAFEEGRTYEARTTALGHTNGAMFTPDDEGARKLTFEVTESAVETEYGGP